MEGSYYRHRGRSKIFARLVEHDRAALGVGSDPAENLPR
jgi:hypothetical protein